MTAAATSQAAPAATGADLTVKVWLERTTPAGDSLEPVVVVRNRGPRAARRLVLFVRIPFVLEATSSSGRSLRCHTTFTPGVVRCTLPRLAARGSASIRLLGTAPQTSQTLAVTASVRSATRDPARRNNTHTATTIVS